MDPSRNNQALLQAARIFHIPVSPQTLAKVSGVDQPEQALASLAESGQITEEHIDGRTRYRAASPLAGEEVPTEQARQAGEALAEATDLDQDNLAVDAERHRLAMIAGDAATAFETGDRMAAYRLNAGQIAEAREICEQTLTLGEDFGLRHTLGMISAAEGDTESAIHHLERALESCPASGDPEVLREKAAILSHLAEQLFLNNALFRAIRLWEQAADLFAETGDRDEQANILDVVASVFARQGDADGAETYWKRALEQWRKAGDTAGEATTLGRLAWLAQSRDDKEQFENLARQACRALEAAGLWPDLAVLINKLGSENRDWNLLAQALWLTLQIDEVPLEALVNLGGQFVHENGRDSEDGLLIAAAVLSKVEARNERDHPRFPELYRIALDLYLSSAKAHGIPETEIREWTEKEGHDDPAQSVPRALKALEARVDEGQWLFSPRPL